MAETIKVKKLHWWYYPCKYAFDFLVALLTVILFSLLLLILMLIVKFSSRGPIFYKDQRVGKNGKLFNCLKFRTMYVDANEHPEKYFTPEQLELWERERKVDEDPRITKVGKLLRKTSLDELPQLFNILAGQMSLVGPRPVTEKENNDFFTEEERQIIYTARPGITGYWQVHGRNEVSYLSGERTRLTLEYFEYRSLWLDFKILVLTIPTVLSTKGAV